MGKWTLYDFGQRGRWRSELRSAAGAARGSRRRLVFAAAAALLGPCKVSSAAGDILLTLLASRVLVEHRDRQGYPEEVMLVRADADVVIAFSHRHVE